MFQNFQGLRTAALFLGALVIISACENGARQKSIPGPNDKIYSVEFTSVFEEEIPDILTLKGRFQASAETEIKSSLSGQIQDFNVQEGQNVLGGELLFRIQNERLNYVLERQKAELREAEAELELLNKYELPYEENFQDSPNNENENQEDYPEDNVIDEQSGSSPQEFRNRVRQIIRKRQNNRLQRNEAEAEEIQESRQNLQQAKIERIQSEINLTEKQIENTNVTAPYNGFISKLSVAAGQKVEEGEVLLKIIKLDPIDLELEVPQDSASLVRSQTPVKVNVPLIPKKIYEGYISFISARLNTDQQTLPLKVSVNNFDQKIKAEMEGEAQIVLSNSKHLAKLVPQTAIVYHEKNPHVYLISGQVAIRQSVKLGSVYQDWIEIKEGVRIDDKVISKGVEQLREKEEFVKAKEAS
ncbi:MAG: efflux RND transporter periplasmic adaptor subunit [Deltaproteobacteria bacterium]|nr:efflux RND transporter periplasmic adaptor subunit [Deltaproteobacteria bacterium]